MPISKGLTAAYDKLYEYSPFYDMNYGRMTFLFIATVLHPKYKLRYFWTRESFPRETIKHIKADLNILYMIYGKYYGKQENLEVSSPANHQYTIANSKDDCFSYLSNDDVVEKDDKKSQPTFPKNWKAPQSKNFIAAIGKGFQCFMRSQEILWLFQPCPTSQSLSSR